MFYLSFCEIIVPGDYVMHVSYLLWQPYPHSCRSRVNFVHLSAYFHLYCSSSALVVIVNAGIGA